MFYDGGCPLCRREVAHYQRLDTAQRIRWINIDSEPEVLDTFRIAHPEAMGRLHVLTPDGKIVTGAQAFATVWAALPYYRGLGYLVKRLRLLKPLDRLYALFARWRYHRRLKELGEEKTRVSYDDATRSERAAQAHPHK